jgi:uncharacterized membrane protein YhhN
VSIGVLLPWAGLGLAGLILALLGEFRGGVRIMAPGKLVAASAYFGAAVAFGAAGSAWGQALLAGMACCWVGDMLLVSRKSRALFLAGLLAFFLGHLCYSWAFLLRGQSLAGWLPALLVMSAFSVGVLRWLRPFVDRRMRRPVVAYVAAISAMMVLAAGSFAAAGGWLLLAGAALFVLSDLAVARNRFVAKAFLNRALGLPAYFVAQFMLAASTAA